jgi:hypothetical protein
LIINRQLFSIAELALPRTLRIPGSFDGLEKGMNGRFETWHNVYPVFGLGLLAVRRSPLVK